MPEYRYEVDYAVDHAALARAAYRTAYVTVQADNAVDAELAAAQMVGHRGIPTATRRVKEDRHARDD